MGTPATGKPMAKDIAPVLVAHAVESGDSRDAPGPRQHASRPPACHNIMIVVKQEDFKNLIESFVVPERAKRMRIDGFRSSGGAATVNLIGFREWPCVRLARGVRISIVNVMQFSM